MVIGTHYPSGNMAQALANFAACGQVAGARVALGEEERANGHWAHGTREANIWAELAGAAAYAGANTQGTATALLVQLDARYAAYFSGTPSVGTQACLDALSACLVTSARAQYSAWQLVRDAANRVRPHGDIAGRLAEYMPADLDLQSAVTDLLAKLDARYQPHA